MEEEEELLMGAKIAVQRSCHLIHKTGKCPIQYIPAEKLAELTVETWHLIEEEEESLCVYLQGGNTTVTTLLLLNLLTFWWAVRESL